MTKTLNVRNRQWKAYLRHERKAGRIGRDWFYPRAYERHVWKWVRRGRWRERIDRKWQYLYDFIE